jgi:tetratricopeptide (TPR) repeat protein
MPDDLEQWLSLIDDQNLIERLVHAEFVPGSPSSTAAPMAAEAAEAPAPDPAETPEPAEEPRSPLDALDVLELASARDDAPAAERIHVDPAGREPEVAHVPEALGALLSSVSAADPSESASTVPENPAADQPSVAPPNPLESAVDLLRTGDLERAAEAFWNAIEAKTHPDLANVGLGTCLLRMGQSEAALHAFEDAIHAPQRGGIAGVNDHAWFGVAISRLLLGQCKLAEDALNRVSANQADRDELRTAWTNLGASYYEAAEYANAIRAFEFALSLGGADPALEARLAAAREQAEPGH